MGGQWSTYWYNGYIYGSEIARGVDVFKLVPSKYLTQNEIDAANQVQFAELNVQNQQKIVWPANFVVAKAYIDQLARSNALDCRTVSSAECGDRKGRGIAFQAEGCRPASRHGGEPRQGCRYREDHRPTRTVCVP